MNRLNFNIKNILNHRKNNLLKWHRAVVEHLIGTVGWMKHLLTEVFYLTFFQNVSLWQTKAIKG